MENKVFLKQLEERLEENRKLSERRGLPVWMAPAASVLGLRAWEGLLFGSFVVTALLFLVWPIEFMRLVRLLLIMQ
jgi:hypothetical protein